MCARIFPSRLVISFPFNDGGKMTEKRSERMSEKERCAEPFSQGPPLKGPHQPPRATKEGPSEYIRVRSACNDLRASRSTARRGGLGFFDRSAIPVTVEGDPEG